MTNDSPLKSRKIDNPAETFEKPNDVVTDEGLSSEEKKKALDTWEQDAHQLLTASNEGMPGRGEGVAPEDSHRLGEVVRVTLINEDNCAKVAVPSMNGMLA